MLHWGANVQPLKIAPTIYLRPAPNLPVAEVYEALNMSRACAYERRRNNGFPAAAGGMIETRALATWLRERAQCQIVWI